MFERFQEWAENVEWGLWANLFLFLGSVGWVLSPVWCFQNEVQACSSPAFVGAILLFIDGFLWIVDYKILETKGQQHIFGGGIGRPGTWRWKAERVPWFFFSILFFFLGTCGDIAASGIDTFAEVTEETESLSLFIDIFACGSWVISAFSALALLFFDDKARTFHKAPIRYTLIPTCTTGDGVGTLPVYMVNWLAYSVISFTLGSILYFFGGWWDYFVPDNFTSGWTIQIVGGVTLFFESLFLFIFFFVKWICKDIILVDMQQSAQAKLENEKYFEEESKLVSGSVKTSYISFESGQVEEEIDDHTVVPLEDHRSRNRTSVVEISSDVDYS